MAFPTQAFVPRCQDKPGYTQGWRVERAGRSDGNKSSQVGDWTKRGEEEKEKEEEEEEEEDEEDEKDKEEDKES